MLKLEDRFRVTYHQVKNNEVLVQNLLDLVVFRENLPQCCRTKAFFNTSAQHRVY